VNQLMLPPRAYVKVEFSSWFCIHLSIHF